MKFNIRKELSLLKELYMIEHPSNNEEKMISYILNYCYKINNINIEIDHYHNLFITKNTTNPELYPCMIAHLDENQFKKEIHTFQIKNDVITAYDKSGYQSGLGADDSNGIFIILLLLKVLPNLKVCFTLEEEIGAAGAREATFNKIFFNNCQYLLQADRRGSSDLIITTNGINITTPEFLQDVLPVANNYNYKIATGTFTDVGVICPKVKLCGLNISCGYQKEHTSTESTNLMNLQNCYNFIINLITTLNTNQYILPKVVNDYNYYKPKYTSRSHYDDYEIFDEHGYIDPIFNYNYNDSSTDYVDPFEACISCREQDCMRCEIFKN